MAVETLLRGVIVLGLLAIGGITASALLRDDPPPPVIAPPAQPASTGDAEGDTVIGLELPREGQGQLEVELPGGFGFKLPADVGTFDETDFDIGGVGLYPGGTLRDMKVRILKERDAAGGRARVSMAFTAPDAPDVVADWYAEAFDRAGTATIRQGNALTGITRDGDRFSLEVLPDGRGSRGTVEIGGGRAG